MKNLRFTLTALALLAVAAAPAFASTQIRDTAAGYQLGTTATQPVGFHGASPTAQRAGSAQAALPVLTAATGTLTFTAQPLADETVTLGATTYTFKATLSTGPAVANEVLLGENLAAAKANLISAVNASAGEGTTYGTGTTANASVTAAAGTTSTIVFTAKTSGVAGNSVASTETSTVASFGGATLAGGVDAATIAQITTLVNELRAAEVEKGLIKGAP